MQSTQALFSESLPLDNQQQSQKLIDLLTNKLGSQLVESGLELGDAVVRINRDRALDFFKLLKLDAEFQFNMLSDLTAIDWMDQKQERFEVVYHLLSLTKLHRLRVRVFVPEQAPELDSVTSLWAGANFMEREAWDMYGVVFKGHPDLRRILMYDEFKGHPLRKDYPVQGKQPRIPLRSAEVQNTARDMTRPALVKINKRPAGIQNIRTSGEAST
jgi:NADH-quinone oxidoreductase subunit C